MDKAKIIGWGKWILAHGIAWGLATWLGYERPIADNFGVQGADLLIGLVLLAWSIYDSYKGRAKVKE